MRPLSSSLLLHFFTSSSFSSSSPSPLFLFQFSPFSTSSNSSSFHSSSSSKRYDEESRNAKVSVWWDFENCNLPAGVNVFKVSHLITSALRFNGIKGPVQITAFGDVLQLSRTNQEALSSTGINLTHVPQGGKNSADRSLLIDLMYWVSQNPPPAHLLLISGDRDFASILHRLRMNNYNILLASTESAPSVLSSAASIMWYWHALIKGENLVGKCFNQPPYGRFGSWYNQNKAPVEDPYALIEQPSCSRREEVCQPVSESKVRPVPKAVVKQIRQILKSYPKGVSLSDLRLELGKSNVSIDKDLYGYRKFHRFLLSMPQIVKLQPCGDGQFVAQGVNLRFLEPLESTRGTSSEVFDIIEDPDVCVNKSNGQNGSLMREDFQQARSESESLISAAPDPNIGENSKPSQSDREVCNVGSGRDISGNLSPILGHDSVSDLGFVRKTWKKWFSEDNSHDVDATLEKKSYNYAENHSSTQEYTEKKTDPVCSKDEYKTRANPGIISRIRKWFSFWESGEHSGEVSDQSSEQPNIEKDRSGHLLFSDNSFWLDLESFMKTPEASVLISKSKSREELARNMQREGPSALKLLSNFVLFDLVNLLISDKKWVEENPSSHLTRFKLTPSSTFSIGASDKYHKNSLQTGVVKKEYAERSKSEILEDCQKLVNEILKEFPEGYSLGSFRRFFWERYGYQLDVQKLGYRKLVSLLQTLPGVKIESSFIFPSSDSPKISCLDACVSLDRKKEPDHRKADSEAESSGSLKKDDDLDSPWEELGPVSSSRSFKRSNEQKVQRRAGNVEYESAFSDDYFTDSEEECLSFRSDERIKQRDNTENSSLLQILDLWYNWKEGCEKKEEKRENSDGLIDFSADKLKSSSSSKTGSKKGSKSNEDDMENSDWLIDFPADKFKSSSSSGTETVMGINGKKQRPQKIYSFVADPDENKEEKLVDDILDSLKKSSESKIRS